MNSKRLLFTSAIFILTLFATASLTHAQGYWVGFDAIQYDADIDDTIDVTILLFEDVSNGSDSRLAPGGENGLFAFSAGVSYSSVTGGNNGVTFDSFTLHPYFQTGFAGSGADLSDDGSTVAFEGIEEFNTDDGGDSQDGEPGVSGFQLDADLWAVELGTLSFTPGDPSTVTTLVAAPHPDPNANPLVFADSFSVVNSGWSSGNTSSAQIRIGAVPEPGSASILVLSLLGFTGRRRVS